MSTSVEKVGEGRALALVPSQPWYATAPTAPFDRQSLKDEHTCLLARAVGDICPTSWCCAAHPVTELAQRRGVGVGECSSAPSRRCDRDRRVRGSAGQPPRVRD